MNRDKDSYKDKPYMDFHYADSNYDKASSEYIDWLEDSGFDYSIDYIFDGSNDEEVGIRILKELFTP